MKLPKYVYKQQTAPFTVPWKMENFDFFFLVNTLQSSWAGFKPEILPLNIGSFNRGVKVWPVAQKEWCMAESESLTLPQTYRIK